MIKSRLFMISVIILALVLPLTCRNGISVVYPHNTLIETEEDEDEYEDEEAGTNQESHPSPPPPEFKRETFDGCTLNSFFGKPLVFTDSASVMKQIAAIAARDDQLSLEDNVLRIGKVKWGVNVHNGYILLLTSVSSESPKMRSVVKYLIKKYGEPLDGPITEENYEWLEAKWTTAKDRYTDEDGRTDVTLRPLRQGGEGMVLIIE